MKTKFIIRVPRKTHGTFSKDTEYPQLYKEDHLELHGYTLAVIKTLTEISAKRFNKLHQTVYLFPIFDPGRKEDCWESLSTVLEINGWERRSHED